MGYRLGVDVGGTFTDVLLVDERTGTSYRTKTASTPQDQSIGVLSGIRKVCEAAGIEVSAPQASPGRRTARGALMTDHLAEDYRASGFAGRLGCGRSPAVLAVDIVRAYLVDGSPLRAPVEDAVRGARPSRRPARPAARCCSRG